jgi:hypothetical protein
MRHRLIRALGVALAWAIVGSGFSLATVDAQKKPVAKVPVRRAAPLPAPVTEPAMLMCPTPLGEGVSTKRSFCDVLTGRDPNDGIIVTIPPHVGDATITFDLHNRVTYSEELIKANRSYRRFTASIGVLTMDNTLVSRALIQGEYRNAKDLVDRIGGGAGPGGVKAVAPTGTEPISITIPAGEGMVSILGEKLAVERLDGVDNFTLPGQPVAIVSNVMIDYRPAPPKRTPAPRATPAPKKR